MLFFNASTIVQVRNTSTSRLEPWVFFSIFFFWRKTGRVIDRIKRSEWEGNRSVRIHANSYMYAWKWEERDGNSGGGKVQEIALFRCHFHGNWVPREGPPSSPVAFRRLDPRRAMKHGKKEERERMIRLQQGKKKQLKDRFILKQDRKLKVQTIIT